MPEQSAYSMPEKLMHNVQIQCICPKIQCITCPKIVYNMSDSSSWDKGYFYMKVPAKRYCGFKQKYAGMFKDDLNHYA